MGTIISSCITAVVTLVVCLITNHAQAARTQALLEYRMDELTKAVQKHNGIIERVFHLETDSIRHDDELRRINHRLKELEDDEK